MPAPTDEEQDMALLDRQSLLKIGGMGLLGVSLPRLMRAAWQPATIAPRAKSVICLFQWGGPSQLDVFDMKPQAPDTIRSPYQSFAS